MTPSRFRSIFLTILNWSITMSSNIQQAIDFLRKEVSAKKAEIRDLQDTIANLEGKIGVSAPRQPTSTTSEIEKAENKATPWSDSIDEVFLRHDHLALKDVCELLVEDGVIDEVTDGNRASVSSTLTRKVKQGKLTKRDGIYSNMKRTPQLANETRRRREAGETASIMEAIDRE